MPKFMVVEGVAIIDGVLYRKNDVLFSPHDLEQDFKLKFQRVNDATPLTRGTAGKQISAGGPKKPAIAMGPKTDDELLDGLEEEGKARVANAAKAGAKDVAPSTAPRGIDVTAKFPEAVEEDYKVYKYQGQYFIYDEDDQTKPVNAEGVNKADVLKVVRKALNPA